MLEPGFVTDTIRRLNRNLLLVCLAGLTFAVSTAFFTRDNLYNVVQGPFPLSTATLLTTPDLHEARERYVTVVGEMLGTSYEHYTGDADGSNGRTLGYYGTLVIGDRLLLVEVPEPMGNTPAREYTGTLIAPPNEVRRDIISPVERENEQDEMFLPYVLKTTDSWNGVYFTLVTAVILLVLSISGLIIVFLYATDPASHYSLRKLKRYGDPALIANQINREMAMPSAVTVQGVHFTHNWLVHITRFRLRILRISDITWSYRREFQHSTHGTQLGKGYSAIIWDRHKTRIEISGKQNKVDAILKAVVQRAPWALVGSITSDQIYKNYLDHFVAQVEARKEELKGQP